jgi:hypothetical protein
VYPPLYDLPAQAKTSLLLFPAAEIHKRSTLGFEVPTVQELPSQDSTCAVILILCCPAIAKADVEVPPPPILSLALFKLGVLVQLVPSHFSEAVV